MEQQLTRQEANNGKTIVRRSEEDILKHLDEQEKSGFTVKEYCELYEIVEQTFYSWLKKYRPKPEDEVKGFAPIEVVSPVVPVWPQLFAEVGNIKIYKEVPAEYLKSTHGYKSH
ncbi:IS66 family insertion sequence element accessory protein TnpA [Chitinophaga cymbidii]|uniref:Transposase n=1 Tax=Chitinophaga cymbidii TaxID=1096750 RepID=A0A512RFM3_9BACT|nr:hypothetical protein [Chitinophaga cymbidii]GEP94517.1 hypothetical protein CCY01nite_07770 [Chitinophaga cymbidii]